MIKYLFGLLFAGLLLLLIVCSKEAVVAYFNDGQSAMLSAQGEALVIAEKSRARVAEIQAIWGSRKDFIKTFVFSFGIAGIIGFVLYKLTCFVEFLVTRNHEITQKYEEKQPEKIIYVMPAEYIPHMNEIKKIDCELRNEL